MHQPLGAPLLDAPGRWRPLASSPAKRGGRNLGGLKRLFRGERRSKSVPSGGPAARCRPSMGGSRVGWRGSRWQPVPRSRQRRGRAVAGGAGRFCHIPPLRGMSVLRGVGVHEGEVRSEKFPGLGVHQRRPATDGRGLVAGGGAPPAVRRPSATVSARCLAWETIGRLRATKGPFLLMGDPSRRQLLLPIRGRTSR